MKVSNNQNNRHMFHSIIQKIGIEYLLQILQIQESHKQIPSLMTDRRTYKVQLLRIRKNLSKKVPVMSQRYLELIINLPRFLKHQLN